MYFEYDNVIPAYMDGLSLDDLKRNPEDYPPFAALEYAVCAMRSWKYHEENFYDDNNGYDPLSFNHASGR